MNPKMIQNPALIMKTFNIILINTIINCKWIIQYGNIICLTETTDSSARG